MAETREKRSGVEGITSVWLGLGLNQELASECEKAGVSKSRLVRYLIRKWLRERKEAQG